MIMLLTPESMTAGLEGMDLLQTSMKFHVGEFGVVFTALILWLFSFSTFIGILFYARPNIAYLFGDNWISQTLYKVLALIMLFVGGLAAYTFVWDLGDIGVGLMTIFNMMALIPMAPQAVECLRDYEKTGDEGAKKHTLKKTPAAECAWISAAGVFAYCGSGYTTLLSPRVFSIRSMTPSVTIMSSVARAAMVGSK